MGDGLLQEIRKFTYFVLVQGKHDTTDEEIKERVVQRRKVTGYLGGIIKMENLTIKK